MNDIVKANAKKAIELDHKHDADKTRLEKLINRTTELAGSVGFIVSHSIIFAIWIAFNSLAGDLAFDPYPFTFLTLTVSLEAILLTSMILISQNQTSLQQDRRHQLDLQLVMLSEQENTMMMRVLARISDKLGIDCDELEDYLDETRIEDVLEDVEKEEESKR